MATQFIDAALLKKIFLAGAQRLEANKEWINELNVFPVPDGDTGTNMTLTIMSAAKEVQSLEEVQMKTLAKAISSGSLRGARGNSGVILSQLFRGFCKEIGSAEVVDIATIAKAARRATDTAYKAVMKPKEGTILTVARSMAEKAEELAEDAEDIETYLEAVIAYGDEALEKTPELLPVLKQAGVVDSGGQGLMQVMKGIYDCLTGKVTVDIQDTPKVSIDISESTEDTADIKFGYCTEFIVNIEKEYNEDTEHDFKSYLESIGDSIVLVSDDEIVKVHVHTNDPGLAIQKALTYGSLSRMKIDNMREEHREKLIKDAQKLAAQQKAEEEAKKAAKPRKEYGFIAVSIGEGINSIFTELGVDYIIEGGQTMNPSTEDMLNAIDKVHADTIFILPNNKNIILAAEQAMHMTKDKKIVVVPSKNIPQGISAIISFMPEMPADENKEAMTEAMSMVKTAQITYAVRDTSIDGFEIKQGDIMGIGDKGMLTVKNSINEAVISSLEAITDDDSELISIYYGADVNEEDAMALKEQVEELFGDCDIEFHCGGQPVYYYVMSVE
ncbi:MAG: DAK2 domain-containing protein [Lachnospiraceae bacterium]|nr:DAK2 domain-containing protein [Lachnospiraceae bacterium]